MRTSEQIDLIASALAEAQKTIQNPIHNSKVSAGIAGTYTYANLSSLHDILRKPLSDNGLSYVQSSNIDQERLITRLMHKSGQWMEFEFPCKCWGFTDAKKLGSWLTYMRRYSLGAIFQIHGEEDTDAVFEGKALETEKKDLEPPKLSRNPEKQPAPKQPDPSIKQFSGAEILAWKEHFGFKEGEAIYDYAKAVADHYKQPVDNLIQNFMANEESFVKAFNNWQEKRKSQNQAQA